MTRILYGFLGIYKDIIGISFGFLGIDKDYYGLFQGFKHLNHTRLGIIMVILIVTRKQIISATNLAMRCEWSWVVDMLSGKETGLSDLLTMFVDHLLVGMFAQVISLF